MYYELATMTLPFGTAAQAATNVRAYAKERRPVRLRRHLSGPGAAKLQGFPVDETGAPIGRIGHRRPAAFHQHLVLPHAGRAQQGQGRRGGPKHLAAQGRPGAPDDRHELDDCAAA